jgi:hypothetical protein
MFGYQLEEARPYPLVDPHWQVLGTHLKESALKIVEPKPT